MSEKDETISEAPEETLKWPLPFNIGIDKLDKIIKAFFQVQADTHAVSANDLVGRTGVSLETIKRNIKFLSAMGIIRPGESKDSYLLEAKGATYAKALSSNDAKTTSTTLKELLTNSCLKELVDFVELQKSSGSLTFDQLFSHIKTMARVKEDPKYPRGVSAPYTAGISALIDFLSRAGIISEEVSAKKETTRTTAQVRKAATRTEQQPSVGTRTITSIGPIQGTGTNFPFTLNITVEAKDPESIKQLISLIRELRGQDERINS